MRELDRIDEIIEKRRKSVERRMALISLVVFILFIGMATFIYSGIRAIQKADWSGGIKPVVEQAWCGEKDCMSK